MSNLPPDWNSFYNTCGRCGDRYHASERECSCLEKYECACGTGSWEGNDLDTMKCSECGTGSKVQTIRRSTIQVARKDHNNKIKKGDTYRRIVIGGYYPNGPRWLDMKKVLITKAF